MDVDLFFPQVSNNSYELFRIFTCSLTQAWEVEIMPISQREEIEARSVNTTLLKLEFQFEAINPKCCASNHHMIPFLKSIILSNPSFIQRKALNGHIFVDKHLLLT